MIRTNDCQTSFSHAPAKWRQVTRKGRRHKVWSKAVERLLSFIHLKGTTRNFGVLVPNITHWRNGSKRKRLLCQKFCLAFGSTFLGFGPSQSMKENCGDFQLTKIGYCSLLCWFGTNFLLHVCSVLSGWQFSVTNGNNGGMYASAFMKLAEKKGTAGFCPLIISRLGQKPPPHLVSISYWENAFHPVTFWSIRSLCSNLEQTPCKIFHRVV